MCVRSAAPSSKWTSRFFPRASTRDDRPAREALADRRAAPARVPRVTRRPASTRCSVRAARRIVSPSGMRRPYGVRREARRVRRRSGQGPLEVPARAREEPGRREIRDRAASRADPFRRPARRERRGACPSSTRPRERPREIPRRGASLGLLGREEREEVRLRAADPARPARRRGGSPARRPRAAGAPGPADCGHGSAAPYGFAGSVAASTSVRGLVRRLAQRAQAIVGARRPRTASRRAPRRSSRAGSRPPPPSP